MKRMKLPAAKTGHPKDDTLRAGNLYSRFIIKKLIVLLLLAVSPVYFLIQFRTTDIRQLLTFWHPQEQPLPTQLEQLVTDAMPLSTEFAQFGLDIRIFGGQNEQNGILVSEHGLMRNIDKPIPGFVKENTRTISEFSQDMLKYGNKQTFLAIIPTASGVLQQSLPRFAGVNINQKRMIEQLYNDFGGEVQTVDVFSQLSGRSDQYIYYRTENNLTALGGYYTYSAIVRRLQIGSDRSLSRFDIEYFTNNYYGDLYMSSRGSSTPVAPYRRVSPDTLSLFRYNGSREYTVTLEDDTGTRTYHTLYPEQCAQLGSEMDIYLGGTAAITTIRSSSPKKQRLLVFGDKTAAAYLPFLANHYQQVTMVNLYHANSSMLQSIDPSMYDNVLFAYGIESFIHTNHPAKADEIDREK